MALVAPESNGNLVEGNSHGSLPNVVATKPAESPAHVDSVSVNVADTSNKLGDCKHFSIRGYVSEVRKKDRKKCWPFALEHDIASPDENNDTLPPLHVPNFRWWHCRNCLKDSEEGFLVAEGSFLTKSIKPKSGFCTHMSSHNLSLEQLMPSQQVSSLKMIELGKVDAGSFVDKHRNSHYHSLCNSTKPTSEKENSPLIVGSQNQRKKRTPVFNFSAPVVPHSMQQQTYKKGQKEVVALRKIRNGSLDIPSHDLRHSDVCKADISADHPNGTLHNASESHETLKEKPNHGEPTNLLCSANKESRTGSRISSGLKDNRSNHPPLEMEENYDFSETAEALQGTPGGSHRRRTRKVKLLTELLDKGADEQTHYSKKRDSSSRALSERPEGEKSALAPRVLAGAEGDPASSSVQHSGKRKFTPEEEWNSLNTSCTSKKAKTLNFKRDGEDTDARLSSSSEEAFERAGSCTRTENHLISFNTDRGPTLVKRKKKKTNAVTRHVPLIAPQEFVQPEASIRAADAITNNLFKSGDAAVAGKALSAFPSSLQKPEKKSLSKKKGKTQEHDGLMYPDLSNSSMVKERLMSRREKDTKQSKSFSGAHKSTEDISAGKSSLFSFNNWVPAQRYDKKLGNSMRDRPPFLSWRLNNDSQHYVGYSRFPSTSERGVNVLGGVPADPSYRRQTCAVPWPKEKQMPPSLAEAGSPSLVNRLDDRSPSNNFGSLETPERLAFSRRCSRQGVDPIAETGASDDIPMEIVELMAKHQFERCLPDAETDKQFSGAKSDSRNSHRLDLNRAYGNEEALSPSQEEIFHNTKPTSNARTVYATGSHNMTSSKLKSVDFIPRPDRNLYNPRQVEHMFGHKVFRPFPQFVERQQSEVQYTAKSSSRHTSPESGQWIRKTVDRKSQCSHSNMPQKKSGNTYPAAPHCKEGTQFWPPMTSNNFPVPKPLSFDIVPVRSVEQPISEQPPSHYHSFNIKGTITEAHHHLHHHHHHLSFKSSNPEKDDRKADSNATRRTQANPKAACKHSNSEMFDLSPNDVVPAMHLLSLMDPRIRQEAHVNTDGNHEFLKKPPFLYDHPSKDLMALPSRGYEVINGMRPQYYDNYGSGKKRVHENITENSSVIPMFGASTSSQKNRSFKTANVRGAVLSKHQGKGKKYLDSGMQNVGPIKRKSASSNFGFDSVCGSVPAHTMPKLVLETKGLISVPMQFHAVANANTQSGIGHAMSNTLLLPRDFPSEFCSINRNPSDFTEPGAGNPYMIRGEDLIPISAFYSDIAPFSTKLGAFKQQKKQSASKEHSRYQTP